MIIYKVDFYNESDSSRGSSWHSSKSEAEKEMQSFKEREGDNFDDGRSSVSAYEFKLSKKGVLDLLSVVAVHPNNG